MEKNSKIYIAGHAGLVGSAIYRNLQSKGYTNLIGRRSAELDLMDSHAVKLFFESEKPDYVIIAAAKVGGIYANNTYRAQFIYENLMIAANLIHQSYLSNIKKLLFLGSTCIYPRDASQPMREDVLLTSPLEYTNEPYAIAKIAGIKLCESYNLQYGCDFISAMPTNLYGPNDNFNLETSHVLPALLRKIKLGKQLEKKDWQGLRQDLKKRPIDGINDQGTEAQILDVLAKYGLSLENNKAKIEIWGTGKPMREFLWSDDLADACVFLLDKVSFKDLTKGQTDQIRNMHINLGTGIDASIAQICDLLRQLVGFKGDFVFNDSKPDGTMKKLTDVSKLHALGWKHKVELKEGLAMFYDWYIRDLEVL